MPTYTNGQQQDVATTGSGLGAGAGDHLPVGDYGGMDYRSAMRFLAPAGWTAWTAITSATLKFYISDHQHVAPKNSAIFCSRQNVPVWSKDQGSQDCESGFSAGNTTQYGDIASVSGSRVSFNSGSTANAAKTIDVTGIVNYYWVNNSNLVFVFDNNGSDQYTEIWSLGKSGTTYDAVLTINYEVQSAPTAPTPTAPAVGAVSGPNQPVFSWTHNDPQGDAQANAEVRIYDAAGTTLLYTWNPTVGSTQSLTAPVALTRGTTYQWEVRTADAATGYGPYSAKRAFSIKANPVVTISTVRKMVFQNGAPRLVVEWTVDQPQATFRVTATGGYDSGIKSGTDQSWVLDTLALTNGTAVTITVAITNTDAPALSASAPLAFTPRYGLTTHKKTLAGVPANWQTPAIASTVPAGCTLQIEYGSAASAGAGAPTAWYPTLSSVPKTQYLWYRVWFIPSATQGPSLQSINIPYDQTVAALDKWGGSAVWPWENPGGLPARCSIDPGEAVYGTRSLRIDPNGVQQYDIVYSTKFRVRAGGSYTLSGLMRSQGNSGAHFRLQDLTAVYASSPQIVTPTVLTEWKRYKASVWVAPADMDVFVSCLTGNGVAGSTAWFDGIKVEESLVATPWNPASVGATVIDAGGVQIDGPKGGLLRYKGTAGGLRDVVEGGANGLLFGGDVSLYSPNPGTLMTPAQMWMNGSVAPQHLNFGGMGGSGQLRIDGNSTTALAWARIAAGTLVNQYHSQVIHGLLVSRYVTSEVSLSLNADAGLSVQPFVQPVLRTVQSIPNYADVAGLKLIIKSLNPIVWELWFQSPVGYTTFQWYPDMVDASSGPNPGATNPASTGWLTTAGLPAGTQYDAVYFPLASGGAAFPVAGRYVGMRFWHSGYNMEFFWNGTYWLTTNLMTQTLSEQPAITPLSVNTSFRGPFPHPTMLLWMEKFFASTYVVSPNSGTVYWNLTVTGSKVLSTINNTPAVVTIESMDANQLLNPATTGWIQVDIAKVSAPGAIYPTAAFTYRLVG